MTKIQSLRRFLVVSAAAVVALASAQAAAAGERNWRMRLTIATVGNGGVLVTAGDHHGVGMSSDGGAGVGVNFEYRYSPRMGFEVGAMAVASDLGVRVGKNFQYPHDWAAVEFGSFVPITFSLNYHPLKKTGVFDLYVGPLAASTFYSNIGSGAGWGVGTGIESGVSFGLGVNMGADLNLGKSRWSLNGGLKYIAVSGSGGSSSGVDLDPLIATFGFGFRF
jgi:outer membrane protein W